MIGCILTGHGDFSLGMKGAIDMIAGEQADFQVVPFADGLALESFEETMKEAVMDFSARYAGVIVFADLLGGTPFKTAMIASQDAANVEVIAGANLPVILEFLGLRLASDDLEQLVVSALNAGKEGLVHVQLNLSDDQADDDLGEGI